MSLDAARQLAEGLVRGRHPQARAAILGGSFASGRATPTSDIDLLLLFERVDHAWRETLVHEGRTVELYGHDLATFEYFCRQLDRPGGRIPMAMMVIEGVNLLPADSAYAALRRLAQAIYAEGPPPLDAQALARRRYEITTLLEDLSDSAHPGETLAIAAKLYELLADFRLRSRNAWTGLGKHLFRRLHAQSPQFAALLDQAMRTVVTEPELGKQRFAAVAASALADFGGPLLDGFALHAPPAWRSAGGG